MLIDAAVLHHHLDDGRGGGDVLARFDHTLQGVTIPELAQAIAVWPGPDQLICSQAQNWLTEMYSYNQTLTDIVNLMQLKRNLQVIQSNNRNLQLLQS